MKGVKSERPHEDCYWVVEHGWLAGEYPGGPQRDEARVRIRQHLVAGVRRFVDLTEPDEAGLLPYDDLLREEAAALGITAEHRRYPIPDFGVPADVTAMHAVLDHVDEAVRAGDVVYLHCFGGRGRTGTVVACSLVRTGIAPAAALDRVQDLFMTMAKARGNRWDRSPETEAQRAFVRAFAASVRRTELS